MAKDHVGYRDAEQQTFGYHRAAGERLERINRAQMTLTEKYSVIAELFRAPSAPMDLVDLLNPAVNAMQAEFHFEATGISKNKKKFGKALADQRENSTKPQPVAHGTTGS
jgi:hypothetical protein